MLLIHKSIQFTLLSLWRSVCLLLCFITTVHAVTPYQPDIEPYIFSPQAWIELEGLPNDSIVSIVPDKNNNLWMGAGNVILKYDGNNITKYVPKTSDKETELFLYFLVMRDDGEMFAMSPMQLFHFNGQSWQPYGPEITAGIPGYWLREPVYESNNHFWQASDNRLLRIDEHSFELFPLSDGSIEDFFIDDNEDFWLLFKNSGDVKRYRFINHQLEELNHWPSVISDTKNSQFSQTGPSALWLVSENKKQPPLAFDPQLLNVQHNIQPKSQAKLQAQWQAHYYPSDNGYSTDVIFSTDAHSQILFSNNEIIAKVGKQWRSLPLSDFNLSRKITSVKQAENGDVWILEQGKSIRRFSPNTPRVTTYNNLIFGCQSGNYEFFIEKSGDIIQHNITTKQWHRYNKQQGLISTPLNILCTKNGNNNTHDIIVYGADNHVAAISIISRRDIEKHIAAIEHSHNKASWKKILLPQLSQNIGALSVIESSNGDIFLGRNDELELTHGVIVKLSKNSNNNSYQIDNIPFFKSRAAVISEVSLNKLAVSNQNLFMVDATVVQNESDVNNHHNKNSAELILPNHLTYAWIESLTTDSNNTLWVGTWHYGALAFDGDNWRHYGLNEGLSGKSVASIIAKPNGQIAALTNNGLDWFDGIVWQSADIDNIRAIREGSHLVAGNNNSLWVNQFSRHWAFRFQQPDSKAMMASYQQQDVFKTIKYQPSTFAPRVELQMAKPIEQFQNSTLLSWRGYDQWFETPSKQLKYAYRLNNNAWSIFSSDTSHSFTNLAPDTYTFEVKARDADGNVSAKPAQISFIIAAPFWQQTWFYISIIVAFVTMFMLVFVLIVQRLKQTSKINQARMYFLTNISHELRNPLSLIISPLEQFFHKHKIASKDYDGLHLALRNANRLKQLLDQLLSYRRLKTGYIQLDNKPEDLILMIRLLLTDLNFIADKKQQSITLSTKLHDYFCLFDHDVVRKILENIITNALKYSPEESTVFIEVKQASQGVIIRVEDQGIGIPIKEQKHIFTPFYTQKEHRFGSHMSFGIGLALVKELMTLNKGSIRVASPPPNQTHGTVFTLEFPYFQQVFDSLKKQEVAELTVDKAPTELATTSQPITNVKQEQDNPIHVLVVDDNVELAQYIQSALSESFICHVKYDGLQALEFIKQHIPDVIVSDYKMPNMDGIALCKALKEDVATSHIPVLLHTAMVSDEHQLKGLAFGAVDYLMKPVSIPVLTSRINSLIQNRQYYANYLQQTLQAESLSSMPEPSADKTSVNEGKATLTNINHQLTISAQEEKFLALVKKQLLANYKNASFNAEQLAQCVHMSRSAFYRKFTALTNITPAEYIKSHRLSEAKKLLQQGYMISEIIDRIGYADLSSFNRAYKRYFGINPSEETLN